MNKHGPRIKFLNYEDGEYHVTFANQQQKRMKSS